MGYLRLPKGVESYHVPLYNQSVIVASTPKRYNKVLKLLGMEPRPAFGGGIAQMTSNGTDTFFLIGVFDGQDSTLVHEVGHIAFFILDLVGVPVVSGGTNEAYCYLLGDLYRNVAELLNHESASKD